MSLVKLRCHHIHLSVFSPYHRIWFEWVNGERINVSNTWYKCVKISVHIQIFFLILFFGCTSAACGILVPQPVPPSVEASLNHWTSRKFPTYRFLHTCNFLSLYSDSWSVSCLCIQCPKESCYCSESLPGWRHARELFQSPHPRTPGRDFPQL